MLGQLFSKPIVCCPGHVSSAYARETLEGLPYKPSRSVNIQTFPSIMILLLQRKQDRETGCHGFSNILCSARHLMEWALFLVL